MAKPKYAPLTSTLIRRGFTTRNVRIIGPDGQFIDTVMPIEANVAVRCCDRCGAAA